MIDFEFEEFFEKYRTICSNNIETLKLKENIKQFYIQWGEKCFNAGREHFSHVIEGYIKFDYKTYKDFLNEQ